MTDINKTIRTSTKSALTRFINHFDAIKDDEDIDLIDLQNRLQKAEELLDTFNDAQLQIEAADPACEANYETTHAKEREKFEDSYFKITATVKRFVDSRTGSDDAIASASAKSVASTEVNILNNVKLPPLNLPSFDGSFDEWLFFRDNFNSIIHNNESLTNVQKFHYLPFPCRELLLI